MNIKEIFRNGHIVQIVLYGHLILVSNIFYMKQSDEKKLEKKLRSLIFYFFKCTLINRFPFFFYKRHKSKWISSSVFIINLLNPFQIRVVRTNQRTYQRKYVLVISWFVRLYAEIIHELKSNNTGDNP